MWLLSPECHSLCSLYRFKHAQLEAKYQHECNRFNAWNTQVNYYATLFIAMLNCISYAGDAPARLPTEFWLNFALAMISFAFAAAGATIRAMRRSALVVHFVYCLFRIVIFSALIPLSASSWYAAAHQRWIPEGGHIVVRQATGEVIVDEALASVLKGTYSNAAIIAGYVDVVSIWMFFAMTGLNVYTLAGYAFLLATFIPCIMAVPSISPFSLANTLCILLCTTVTYLVLAVVIERIQRSKTLAEDCLLREMRAAQTADSVLNHSLKNTMADVAGHIETYCGGNAALDTLEDAMACLSRGMRICKERQVFLQLAAGQYRPMRNVVPLREFGEQLLAGRRVVARFLDLTVYLDSTLLSLILDNALSNAFKHGCPGDPQVAFDIVELPAPSPAAEPGLRMVQFSVRNAVDPSTEPLTPAFVNDLLSGRHQPKREVPVLSNGIGFSHALMAAKLAGVTIHLQQEGEMVVFSATMIAQEATALPMDVRDHNGSSSCGHFPRGLRFFVLDDSSVARRLLQFLLTSWCDPSVVHCLGAEEADVELFPALALQGADVVIVDQHLEYNKAYLGTDVIRQLRRLGFQGFVCVRSADDSPEDRRRFLEHGANCSFGKDLQGPQFIEALTEAFSLSRNSLMHSDLFGEEDLRGEQAGPPRSDPPARRATLDRFLNVGTPCAVHPV